MIPIRLTSPGRLLPDFGRGEPAAALRRERRTPGSAETWAHRDLEDFSPAGPRAILATARGAAGARVPSRSGILACVGLAALMAACGAPAPSEGHDAPGTRTAVPDARSKPAPRFIVCGVDRSGSYNFVMLGLDLCARLIVEARSGDVVVIRWISDASLRNDEFVARVAVPADSLPDCGGSPFNARCRRERAAAEGRVSAFKRAEIERILALRPESASRTDLQGFLQSASDAFQDAPGAVRELYMATDLVDNVRHRVAPDLRGVTVSVLAFQNDPSPGRTLALRDEWEAVLRGYGAEQVTFRAAEVAP